MATGRKICVGAIVGVHGVRGQVRVRSFTAEPEDVFAYGPLSDERGTRSFVFKPVGVMKDHFVASIKGLTDRNEAEALKGTKLFVDREALPPADEGEYYDADLVDLDVRSDNPKALGKVVALHDYGAGPFLEIKPPESPSYMLPFTNACVPVVDVMRGFVVVQPPEGWLDKAKPEAEEVPEE